MKPKVTLAPVDEVTRFEVGQVVHIPLANPKGEYVRCDGRVPTITVTHVDHERGIITSEFIMREGPP